VIGNAACADAVINGVRAAGARALERAAPHPVGPAAQVGVRRGVERRWSSWFGAGNWATAIAFWSRVAVQAPSIPHAASFLLVLL